MKTLKYILLGIFIITIIFSGQSQVNSGKTYQEIVLQSQGISTKAQLDESAKIISNRLKSLQINTFEIVENNEKNQLLLKIKDSLNVQDLSNVLLVKGKFDFYLTYGKQEVVTQLKKCDSKILIENEKSIADILSLLSTNGSSLAADPTIGLSDSKDTAIITKCLSSKIIKNLLPDDLKFVWGKNADHQNKYTLYAISLNNCISGKMISDAAESDVSSSKIGINLNFNNEGSVLWKNLTGNNLGKAVAMVIDNKVYSAPIVRSEISNGKGNITGNFTAKEIRNLIAIVKNGDLPIALQLIDK